MKAFCDFINNCTETGSVLEFGTGGGGSTKKIAEGISKDRQIYTFDGFVGLPKTKKIIPKGTRWQEGSYCYNENDTRKLLSPYKNVIITKVMTFNLKSPADYGISSIVGANIDVDLYEGTLDGLRFIGKCDWKKIAIRFDDWGYYPGVQVASEIDEHEKAAFYDWIRETKYEYLRDYVYEQLQEGKQSVIYVNR